MQDVQNTQGAKAKKVLISFVGNRDPYAGSGENVSPSWGSVLTVCDKLKPEIVYLFPSSKAMAAKTDNPDNQTEDKANQAREIMERWENGPECHVLPLMTDKPADILALYPCFRDNINKVMSELANRADHRENWQAEYEIAFAISSGTPQMSQTAQLYLSSSSLNVKYYECATPKYKAEENRVRLYEPAPLEETTLLKRIDANVEGFYFHSVIEDCTRLEEMSALRPRKVMAGIVRNVFSAYEKMEIMQYNEAFEIIGPLAKVYSEAKDGIRERQSHVPVERISAILDEQKAFLGKLRGQGTGENAHNLVDLCFNMERAFARGNYVDVLSRFWRLREGMMNFRLLENCCLDRRALSTLPKGKNEKKHDANLRTLKSSRYVDRVDEERDWIRNEDGLRSLSVILCELFQDFELRRFENKFDKKLDHLRFVRNSTIVAHGMAPVKREDVEDCMTIEKEIVALIPGGTEIYKNYPFKPEDLSEIVGLLKHI